MGDTDMTILSWTLLVALAAICVVFFILAAVKMEKPIKQFVTSAIQGLCALGLVNALGGVTGVSLGFSWLAMGMSAVMGMPGVIGLVTLTTVLNM